MNRGHFPAGMWPSTDDYPGPDEWDNHWAYDAETDTHSCKVCGGPTPSDHEDRCPHYHEGETQGW